MTGTCPATSRMICLFDDQSGAMSDRADLRYTICFATDAISSSAMNVSLRLVTKSLAKRWQNYDIRQSSIGQMLIS